MKVSLIQDAAENLTFQEYTAQPMIDGVTYHPLKKHRALEGDFMEYLRLAHGTLEGITPEFTIKQISFSRAVPGRINAFHLHPKETQDEVWCVISGTMMVWLVDVREGSPTVGQKRRYILSGEEPALLYIPTGVAHGYKTGADGALLVYAMNAQFNISDPNEGRLPWDFFGKALWEDDRG